MALAQIKLLTGNPVANPWGFMNDALFDGTVQTPTTSDIVVSQPNGSSIVYHGTFTVVGGDVTGGTVTGFDVFAGSTKVMKGSGFSISAAPFFDALQGIQVSSTAYFNIVNNIPTKFVGSNLNDIIFGTSVNDTMLAKAGDDRVFGDLGDDLLNGGKGNDLLSGNEGYDVLKGGDGKDTFDFLVESVDLPVGSDKIKDFTHGEDVIGLSFAGPSSPPPGYLDDQYFHKGSAATTAEQRVIYDKKSGEISIDRDGNGAEAQFLLATVKAGTSLHADDFFVSGNMLISDARAKHDIEPVGKTFGGTTIYRYRYKAGGPFHFGVMAQEVERTTPDAVVTRPDGLRMVDYAKVT